MYMRVVSFLEIICQLEQRPHARIKAIVHSTKRKVIKRLNKLGEFYINIYIHKRHKDFR